MRILLDSFWRALAYCLLPRVVWLSLLPLLALTVLSLCWTNYFWDDTVTWVRETLNQWMMLSAAYDWLEQHGLAQLQSVLASVVVILFVTPVLIVVSLLSVSIFMSPALLRLVVARRFTHLTAHHHSAWWRNLFWTLWFSVLALAAMLVSLPMQWIFPPLSFVLPALIWGWLSYRVMVLEVLSDYATEQELQVLTRTHRTQLLAIGVSTGLLGSLPLLIWTWLPILATAFVFLVPLALWLYALVFAFTMLWFSHYCLAALTLQRESTL